MTKLAKNAFGGHFWITIISERLFFGIGDITIISDDELFNKAD